MNNFKRITTSQIDDLALYIFKCLDYYFDAEYSYDDVKKWLLQEEIKFNVKRI